MKSVIKPAPRANVMRVARIMGLWLLLAGPFALTSQKVLAQSEHMSPLGIPLPEFVTDDIASITSEGSAHQDERSVSGRVDGLCAVTDAGGLSRQYRGLAGHPRQRDFLHAWLSAVFRILENHLH